MMSLSVCVGDPQSGHQNFTKPGDKWSVVTHLALVTALWLHKRDYNVAMNCLPAYTLFINLGGM